MNFCKNTMKTCEEKFDEYYSIDHLKELDKQVNDFDKGKNSKKFNEQRIKGLRDGALLMYKFKIAPKLKESVKFRSSKTMVKLRLRSIKINTVNGEAADITSAWNKSFIDMMCNIIDEVMPDDSK